MPLSSQTIIDTVDLLMSGHSLSDALATLTSDNTSAIAQAAAIHSLISLGVKENNAFAQILKDSGLALTVYSAAKTFNDGKWDVNDAVVGASLLGQAFALFPNNPAAAALSKFFNVYAVVLPDMVKFGGWLGGEAYRFFNNQDPAAAFQNAETLRFDPIVLDLDGDGIETLSQDAGIHFDLDNNGMAETTGWVSGEDGLLVRDINGNGTIDSGAELMGNHTLLENGEKAANGYEALAELDSNGDGIISGDDAAFDELKVWLDTNSDGISQQDELISLADAGIASLNTAYQNTLQDDEQGNSIEQTSTAIKTDGSVIDTADIWFGVNLTQTVDRNKVALSEELLALPEAYAFGNVRSLRQSMVNNAVLTELVTQFSQATNDSERLALIDSIIYQWAGTADIDPDSLTQGSNNRLDSRQLVTLERGCCEPGN